MTQPGPCTPWITGEDLAARPDLDNDKIRDAGVLPEAALTASYALYVLSGRRWAGTCTATIRPQLGTGGVTWLPEAVARGLTVDSRMAATNGGFCEGGIRLGLYPIRAVTQVKIDGSVLDPSKYRVDEARWLVRRDGQSWPGWQRLDLDDTAVGTFSVTVSYGADPPVAGVFAASALGAELAKSRAGLANRLPQRVQTISRQQVTMSVLDPMSFLDKGLTGVVEVDTFIKAVNPSRQQRRPSVWSPDMQTHRRTG